MQGASPQGPKTTEDVLREMGVEDPHRPRVSFEVIGEIILLVLVGAFFGYLLYESLNWRLGAALVPRIAVAFGAPFWLLRIITLLRHTKATPVQIMDVGFHVGADPKAEAARFTRIIVWIGAVYVAIWLVGFHLALPLGIFIYLLVYGGIGWLRSAAISLVFVAIIIGVYDHVLFTRWHDPLIPRLLDLGILRGRFI